MIMTWEWIGAFFEGEGCVSINCSKSRSSYKVSIAQKARTPLIMIKDFLGERNIPSGIGNPRPDSGVSYLNVCGRDGLRDFLWGIRPYVISKKQSVEDLWRFLKIYPKMANGQVVRLATDDRWGQHVKQTYEEMKAYQRKNKKERYYSDPIFRQARITYATERNKRIRTQEKLKGNGANG